MEMSKRSLNVRMKHEYDDGVNEDTNLILSHAVCAHLSRKTVKGQRHKLTTERDYDNEGSTMHDDSCIGINYAHRSHVPQVFEVTSHIVGLRSVLHVISFNSCRCNYLLNFDLYANSL